MVDKSIGETVSRIPKYDSKPTIPSQNWPSPICYIVRIPIKATIDHLRRIAVAASTEGRLEMPILSRVYGMNPSTYDTRVTPGGLPRLIIS